MSMELFKSLLFQLSRDFDFNGCIHYHFFGEPLLNRSLPDYIRLTREILPDTIRRIFTNGDFLSDKNIEELEEAGIDEIIITQQEGRLNRFSRNGRELLTKYSGIITYRSYNEMTLSNRGGLLDINNGHNGKMTNIPCDIPSRFLIISVKGSVVPCYDDYFQKNTMGNLIEQKLFDIWNSERYIRFRSDLQQGSRALSETCKDCNTVPDNNKPNFKIEYV
jgi:radical SAM protein with 4Fe4S-binding SPASM domain